MNRAALFIGAASAAMAFLLGGCASLAAEHDALCPEIARFANASADLEPHSVVLRTSWGRGLNNDPEHLYEIECSHSDYGPGRTLCRYLMENTSIEFPSYNFRRALACLSKNGRDIGAGVDIVRLDGEFSSYSARVVNDDVKVGIEFTDGTGGETPVLRITAKRWKVD